MVTILLKIADLLNQLLKATALAPLQQQLIKPIKNQKKPRIFIRQPTIITLDKIQILQMCFQRLRQVTF